MRILALLLALAASFVGVTAVATAVTKHFNDPHPSPPARTKATDIDKRLAKSLKAFRRERRADDTLPADGHRLLDESSRLGTNVRHARKVRKGPDGQDYFLVPGNDSIAFVNERGVGSIDDIEHALSGRNVGIEDCAGNKIRLLGIMPDEATNPRVVLSSGAVQALDVEGNVYVELFEKTAASLPQSVEFEVDGTTQQVRVPVPDDILVVRCGPQGQ